MPKLKKITTGFVVQTFDTRKKTFVDQEFVAGDDVQWENENGEAVEAPAKAPYLPFNMESTDGKVHIVVTVGTLGDEENYQDVIGAFKTHEEANTIRAMVYNRDEIEGFDYDNIPDFDDVVVISLPFGSLIRNVD